MSVDQIVMIVLGAAAMIAGLTFIRLRSSAPPPPGRDGDPAPSEAVEEPLGLSEPSRLTIGIVLLVVGYHLVMWAMPAQWASAVAVPQDRWYFVAGGAVVAVVASLLLDRTSSWRRGP